MPTQGEINKALIRWGYHNKDIIRLSTIPDGENKAAQLARIQHARKDYAFFVEYYFPHFCTDNKTGKNIPCAPFHIAAAQTILKETNLRGVFQWARGHAKSTHMDIFIPLWLMCQKERQINVMVLVGKSEDNAQTLLADIQSELQFNKRYAHDFGPQYDRGHWLDGEFVTKDGVAFFARGRGQSPRGLRYRDSRPDYIVIDDLDDDELCQNEARVAKLTDWVREALFGTFGAAGGRFIMVGNLISKNSVLAKVSQIENVKVSRVNAYDKHGNPSWPAFWTKERIEDKRLFMGYRAFEKEYMNNPLTEGAIFLKKHIRYGKMLHLKEYRQLICYTDPSFKNSATADYKATVLMGKTPDGYFHLLKVFADQCSVSSMVGWHYDIMEWVAGRVPVMYFMEANFMQDLMLDEFRKTGITLGRHVPVIGDKRAKGDKFARIEAMQPLFERGLVIFNQHEQNTPGMRTLEDQLLSFQRGSRSHDDAPDALESALWLLSQRARTTNAKYIAQPRPSRRW
ncbi:MAG: phage terminase large subunit [Prevotellaceae bacterium]|jgi:predicted phage terminase large subunit-like protein|nr:phage terminase large subunit [Prevotellaceae bacterium]